MAFLMIHYGLKVNKMLTFQDIVTIKKADVLPIIMARYVPSGELANH